MTDHLDIGAAPPNEDCAQVGEPGYYEAALSECRAYINQLRRVCGPEPDGAKLHVHRNVHDFGDYPSVCVRYNVDNEQAEEYSFRLESDGPTNWDAEALAELGR